MKLLLLGFLILCPVLAAANTSATSKNFSKRTIAASKGATMSLLTGYLTYTGYQVANTCFDNLADNRVDNGLIAEALFYTSYRLARAAWKNAGIALAKE